MVIVCNQFLQIYQVSENIEDITNTLKEAKLPKAENLENLPAAHPCGEAVYEILQYTDIKGTHFTQLRYELEIPMEPAYNQYLFHIPKSATYLVYVKNPYKADSRSNMLLSSTTTNNSNFNQDGGAKYHSKPCFSLMQMEYFRGRNDRYLKWGNRNKMIMHHVYM